MKSRRVTVKAFLLPLVAGLACLVFISSGHGQRVEAQPRSLMGGVPVFGGLGSAITPHQKSLRP